MFVLVTALTFSVTGRPRGPRGFSGRSSDTLPVPALSADSVRLQRGDSLLRTGADSLSGPADSLPSRADSASSATADSLELLHKSSLDRPAFSGAKDSIRQDFAEGRRKMYYYGDVSVTYGNMKLTADYMEYDMATGTVFARGTYDSLEGEWVGRPKMEQDGNTFEMEEVRYNFNSRKSFITNMVTQEDDGILHGKNIKMMEDRSINITQGKYTVCDLEHPHYYLKLSAAKVVTKPSQKTVFGPAHLVVEDVDLPVAIPFGFIPKRPERATGFLMPTFGEENARGFYLRDAGMYFVMGDFFDLSLTGDIYTLGSWAADVNSRYMVKYKFSGNFAFNYSVDQTGERGSSDFFQSKNFGVRWSHSQDSKAHPGTSFSALVNSFQDSAGISGAPISGRVGSSVLGSVGSTGASVCSSVGAGASVCSSVGAGASSLVSLISSYINAASAFFFTSCTDKTRISIFRLPNVMVTTSPTLTSWDGLTTRPLISTRSLRASSFDTALRFRILLDLRYLSILIL